MQVVTRERKEQFVRFDKNEDWFQDHYEDLKRKYNGEYIAIDDAQVLGHNSELERLVEEMRAKYGDLGAFVIEFMTEKKLQLIL